MSPPQRPSGSFSFPGARVASPRSIPVFEVVKTRVLIKLQDRLDVSKSRRMPAALLQETARQQVEQVIDVEAARLARPDRDRLLREVLEEAFGFGPLEELFADASVKEIAVLGPQAVIARRDQGWLPTNIKFRDADHLLEVLDKVRAQGEAVGAPLPMSVLDTKLNNGFRVIAVIPPPASGQPPTVAFLRLTEPTSPTQPSWTTSGTPFPSNSIGPVAHPPIGSNGGGTHTPIGSNGSGTFPPIGSNGGGTRSPAGPGSSAALPAISPAAISGSGRIAPPGVRSSATRSPAPGEDPLERHRVRITERLIGKLASLGVYDLSRVDTAELRKVVAAYVDEYCQTEKVYLSPTDQGRLTLEILTGMNR